MPTSPLIDGPNVQLPQLPQAPSIGDDYAQIAQELGNSAGTLQGNPAGMVGMSYTPMVAYQQRQQAVQQALSLANLNAQIKQQQAKEYMAGAPGRAANIQTGNAEAQDALTLENSGLPMQENIAKRVEGLSESQQNTLQNKAHIWSALANAKSDDEVKQILDYYGPQAIFNGKDLRKVPPSTAKMIATGIQQGLFQSIKAYAGERQRTIAGQYQVQAWQTRGVNAAQIKADADKQIAQLRADVANGRTNAMMARQTLEERARQIIDDGRAKGVPESVIADTVQPYMDAAIKLRSAGMNAKAQATEAAFAAAFGGGTPQSAPVAQLQPTPQPASKFVKGQVYKDKNDNTAIWDGTKFVPTK